MTAPAKKTVSPSRPGIQTVKIAWRDAVDAVTRLRVDHKGQRFVQRFSTGVAIEHFVVTLAVIALAVTGFAQTFYDTWLGSGVLVFFGGIDSVRDAHHAFALILGVAAVYHILNYLNNAIVYRRMGGMWFDNTDWSLLFRLGAAQKPPRFGRYTFAEKVSYWVIAFCVLVLGLTGLVQGFPILASQYLPGELILVARLFHRWEAVLCVAVVLIWHLYDVLVRKLNFSIFTGHMSIKNMEEDHPLELQYLEKSAALVNHQEWPTVIEIVREEPVEASPEKTTGNEEPAEGPKEEAVTDESTESPKESIAKEEK